MSLVPLLRLRLCKSAVSSPPSPLPYLKARAVAATGWSRCHYSCCLRTRNQIRSVCLYATATAAATIYCATILLRTAVHTSHSFVAAGSGCSSLMRACNSSSNGNWSLELQVVLRTHYYENDDHYHRFSNISNGPAALPGLMAWHYTATASNGGNSYYSQPCAVRWIQRRIANGDGKWKTVAIAYQLPIMDWWSIWRCC